MSSKRRIAEATIARLSVYARALCDLGEEGVEIVSSDELGEKVGCTGVQIRKDLSFFGEFGETGKGYHVRELNDALSRVLGIDKRWKVALVGAGHLGSALLAYPQFEERGFSIEAVFDNDARKIGRERGKVRVLDVLELPETVRERDIRIGIIAVPAQVAQEIADMLVSSGVRAMLNFTPARVSVPEDVRVRNVDLSRELECLSYFLTNEAGL